MLGSSQQILVTGKAKTSAELLTGRTASNRAVNFVGSDDMIGKIVTVKITDVSSYYLLGEKSIEQKHKNCLLPNSFVCC